jgi:hypothetical protein
MTNFRRFICVAIPSAITLASVIAMLVVGLAGVINMNVYMFRVDIADLLISSNINDLVDPQCRKPVEFHNFTCPNQDNIKFGLGLSTNVTAVDLDLADKYDIGLWAY